jgi:hypothetical protein
MGRAASERLGDVGFVLWGELGGEDSGEEGTRPVEEGGAAMMALERLGRWSMVPVGEKGGPVT